MGQSGWNKVEWKSYGKEIMMQNNSGKLYKKLIENYNKKLDHSGISGERLAERLDELSKIGETEQGGVTRVGYSKEEKIRETNSYNSCVKRRKELLIKEESM